MTQEEFDTICYTFDISMDYYGYEMLKKLEDENNIPEIMSIMHDYFLPQRRGQESTITLLEIQELIIHKYDDDFQEMVEMAKACDSWQSGELNLLRKMSNEGIDSVFAEIKEEYEEYMRKLDADDDW